MATFQAMFSPVAPFHLVGMFFSSLVPSPRGPRHIGQFSRWPAVGFSLSAAKVEVESASRIAAKGSRVWFIGGERMGGSGRDAGGVPAHPILTPGETNWQSGASAAAVYRRPQGPLEPHGQEQRAPKQHQPDDRNADGIARFSSDSRDKAKDAAEQSRHEDQRRQAINDHPQDWLVRLGAFEEQIVDDAVERGAQKKADHRKPRRLARPIDLPHCTGLRHSGSGLPFVSGRNGRTKRPITNTLHMVTPAQRIGSG